MSATRVKPHSVAAGHPVVDGCLTIGGIPLTMLAERAGGTPFFAYDRRLMTERVGELRAALPARVSLHYAIKANPMPAVVQHLARLVNGFDVASAAELKVALDTPVAADQIGFAGPGKTREELSQAVASGITIAIESESEMRRITEVGERLGLTPRVALRVNPDFRMKGSGMLMGGGPAQFGIDAERIPATMRALVDLGLDFLGFHIFSGSQNLSADVVARTQEQAVELALRLAEEAPGPLRHLNIGGGFGIPYFPNDRRLDLATVGERLGAVLAGRAAGELRETRIIVELGRFIVGEAGFYVTRVVDRKLSRGRTFIVTDGGLHHQLAASGNFGQVIRRNYPVTVGNKADGPIEKATVVGCLCTPLDLLADHAELPEADVGDLVVVFQSGAYGLTASPTAFLSHPAPIEMLV